MLLRQPLAMSQISSSNRNGCRWIGTGAFFGFLAVGLGAFGAHGLQDYLQTLATTDPDLAVKRLANWNTAAQYQMYHALAIVLTGTLMRTSHSKLLPAAAICFSIGNVVFCGFLYCLVIFEIPILGAIVPVGGVSFMVGWLLLAMATFSMNVSTEPIEPK